MEKPGFAVLIKGDWGSGKTWFIEDFIGRKNVEDFIYISLYGLSDTKEIDDLIFEKLHPVLGSKPAVIVGKLFQSALRLGLKIDIGGESDVKLDSSVPKIPISDFTKRLKSKIIIFDDLERNSLKPTILLGYINTFIEHQKLKVILVGDETKLMSNDANVYSDTKEKIIGNTFNIAPVSEAALRNFIIEIKDEKCKNLLLSTESKILKLFTTISYNNLRDLRQTLLSFEYLFINIDDKFKEDTEYFENLLMAYCYLSIEIKANKVTSQNWYNAIEVFFYKELSQKEFIKLSKEEQDKIKETASFNYLFNRYNLPLGHLLFEIVFNGIINSPDINTSIENSHYFKAKNKSLLSKFLTIWRSLNNVEFEKIYLDIMKEFNELKYCHPAEIIQFTDLMILFIDWKLIPLKMEELVQLVLNNIDEMARKDKLIKFDFGDGFPEEYGGVGFSRRETKEFNVIWQKLDSKLKRFKNSNNENEIKKMVESFPNSYEEFNKSLIYFGHCGKFGNDTILHSIDANMFLMKYLLIPNESKKYFIGSLKNRYKLLFSNGEVREVFYPEEKFIIELKELIDNKISSESAIYNIDNFILKNVSNELGEILKQFKKSLKEKSIQN
jgi:hypothetical protein